MIWPARYAGHVRTTARRDEHENDRDDRNRADRHTDRGGQHVADRLTHRALPSIVVSKSQSDQLGGADAAAPRNDIRRRLRGLGPPLTPAPRDEDGYISGAPCSSWRSYSSWS